MKFKKHLILQSVIFLILIVLLNWKSALIITLFHFIPSIDYFMKKIKFHKELHKELTHNLFLVFLVSSLAYHFTDVLIGTLATLNILLHLAMDIKSKKGVMLFYPIVKHSFRIKK